MNPNPLLATLGSAVVVLLFGTLTTILARALRVSPIVGYILLGVAARSAGFQAFETATIDSLAQLGVVFLLFDVGLHFSWRHIRERASDIFAFGPVQILACTLVIGSLGVLAGGALLPMYLMGAALSLSSTAVVARLIAERHQQNCPVGLTATAILVFQDVAGIILLVIIGSLAQPGGAWVGITLALAKAAVAVGLTLLAARFVVGPLFTAVTRAGQEEAPTAAALLVALAASWATAQAGLSLTLGAFLGGMSLADTPFRVVIHSEMSAFRGLLLGFFFLSVGYSLDAEFLLRSWHLVLLAALGLLVVKTLGNVLASLLFRWSVPGSVQLGMLIAQGSEFGLILLSVPQMRTLLGEKVSSVLVSAIALTLALTPAVAQAGRVLAGRMRRRSSPRIEHELTPTTVTAPVLIIGMGQVGRAVADAVRAFDIDYFAIEKDTRRLHAAIADGYTVEYGDSTDTRYWAPMELSQRTLSVLTSPDLNYLKASVSLISANFPNLRRLAIVADDQAARSLRDLGVQVVMDDSPARGLEVACAVLRHLGRNDFDIATWRQRFHVPLDNTRLSAATPHRTESRAPPLPAP